MVAISSLISSINFFNHSTKSSVVDLVDQLTRNLRTGDKIEVIHTPYVLPLGTSNEIGGYARSLGFSFGPKLIAVNMDSLSRESRSMQNFILARQIALFDKSSRCLHLPVAVVAVAIAAVASSILFPASIVAAGSTVGMTALASGAIIAKRERENEHYADLRAFRNCDVLDKDNVMIYLENKVAEERTCSRSVIKSIFSGYPSAMSRYRQLFWDPFTTEDVRQNSIERIANRARGMARDQGLKELD